MAVTWSADGEHVVCDRPLRRYNDGAVREEPAEADHTEGSGDWGWPMGAYVTLELQYPDTDDMAAVLRDLAVRLNLEGLTVRLIAYDVEGM